MFRQNHNKHFANILEVEVQLGKVKFTCKNCLSASVIFNLVKKVLFGPIHLQGIIYIFHFKINKSSDMYALFYLDFTQ